MVIATPFSRGVTGRCPTALTVISLKMWRKLLLHFIATLFLMKCHEWDSPLDISLGVKFHPRCRYVACSSFKGAFPLSGTSSSRMRTDAAHLSSGSTPAAAGQSPSRRRPITCQPQTLTRKLPGACASSSSGAGSSVTPATRRAPSPVGGAVTKPRWRRGNTGKTSDSPPGKKYRTHAHCPASACVVFFLFTAFAGAPPGETCPRARWEISLGLCCDKKRKKRDTMVNRVFTFVRVSCS